ncbi:MAG: hypothetical protein PHI18_04970 [bacterium]|nr:hypothetical protein [bacterium]
MRQQLHDLLACFPRLEETIRHAQVRMLYRRWREPGFRQWTDERARLTTPWEWANVPAEPGELFFGYYDKSPWSSDEDKTIFHFRKHARDPRVEIRVFDRRQATCRIIGTSGTWTFQQGAMTQWLPGSGNSRVIFNDVDQGRHVSRIVGTDGTPHAVIPFPIQALHPGGQEAMSLNYRRLWKYRHPYGYSAPAVNFEPDQPLDRDGIWRINLRTGQSELIVTLAELHAISPRPEMKTVKTKVHHVMYSPSGASCVFVHRWFRAGRKYHRLFGMASDGKGLRLIMETELISHYSWHDDEWLLVFGTRNSQQAGYFEVNVLSGETRAVGGEEFSALGDGHPTYSPDRRWILTDTYPNKKFQQTLVLCDAARRRVIRVGRYVHPGRYFRSSRCDLHPRWSPGGAWISFDSVWTGTRGSFLLDVSALTTVPH